MTTNPPPLVGATHDIGRALKLVGGIVAALGFAAGLGVLAVDEVPVWLVLVLGVVGTVPGLVLIGLGQALRVLADILTEVWSQGGD